jgi:predicted branched-subunit amino acid permease
MQTENAFQQLGIGAAMAAAFTFLLSLSRAREGIRHRLHRLFISLAVYGVVAAVMIQYHYAPMVAVTVGIFAGVIADSMIPKRARHIPHSVRRSLVSNWERKHGKKFDARK